MDSSFRRTKKSGRSISKKIAIFLLLFVFGFSILAIPVKRVNAQAAVISTEVASVPNTITTVKDSLWKTLQKLLVKVGSMAFQQVLRTSLNKIAYDAANWIGSAASGQKPVFVTMDWGKYWAQVGDEAAGTFVESFVNGLNTDTSCKDSLSACQEKCIDNRWAVMNDPASTSGDEAEAETAYTNCNKACSTKATSCASAANNGIGSSTSTNNVDASVSAGGAGTSFNVCSPSSLEVKVKIGLGLVQQNQPQAPNCTASQMVKSWGDAGTDIYQKLTDYQNPSFLDNFKGIFDPTSNDLGIFMQARTDMASAELTAKANSTAQTTANKGWLDVRGIDKSLKGTPEAAKTTQDKANAAQQSNFGKTTGDILVDTANIFLNQLVMSLFDNLMKNLANKTKSTNDSSGGGVSLANPQTDANTVLYGESNLKEATAVLIQPTFGVSTNYDVLSQLSICPNPLNPGPVNCVLDTQFMQAVTEHKTVAEAIKSGYLHGEWQLTPDNKDNNYSLRNISILRQYRILPVGWEVAIQKAYADPANSKKVTLNDLVSCFDANDQYNQFSSTFNTRDQAWCQGLVDPNWVLKAPLSYCARQGVGAQILSLATSPGIKGQGSTADILSSLTITRATDYCGDTKSCVKEKSDGSCEAYGYCNEEKRTWSFGADSCDPIYNTCQTFSSPSGQNVSYLQNTLDYSGCDANNAGCRQYSWFGSYASSSGAVIWDASRNLYLNNKVGECDATSEGCTALLRVKPTWGANLVMDSDFSNDLIGSSTTSNLLNDWPLYASGASLQAEIVDTSLDPGILGTSGKALRIEANGTVNTQIIAGLESNHSRSLLPDNLQIIPGQSYTLSADVYLAAGDHAYLVLGSDANSVVATTTVRSAWQHLSVTRTPSNTYNAPDFNIHGDTTGSSAAGQVILYVKNVKLEMSNWDTGYSAYGSFPINEKILPPYLEKTCYNDAVSATKDYTLKNNAPEICSSFARKCNAAEVGCELYTNTNDNFAVPAKVKDTDYCPAQCVGYDLYISRATYFNSPAAENLMPKTAKTCGAEAVGCNEFTNLDTTQQGGEQKEYYSYLKQCIKPSMASCGSFYSWAGNGNGYQLAAETLEKDAGGNPAVTTDDSALCNATIYNLPVSNPDYNPDCQQFYNAAGAVSYHLISRTITCSDNCHNYRLSTKNVDATLTQAQCTGADKHWDASTSACNVCLNGGAWDSNHGACLYQAIPGEGQVCDAEQNGCREYNGSSGSNVKLAAAYDFESGLSGWYSNCLNGLSLSTVSNNKDGHSLLYSGNAATCESIGLPYNSNFNVSRQPLIKQILASANVAAQVNVSSLVNQGAAYNLKFLARASSDTTLTIYFYNKDNAAGAKAAYFGANPAGTLTVKGGDAWQVYQANLDSLTHAVGPNEVLVITANNNFYLDNVILTEITDRYYLIQNSSVIPDVCYYDIFGAYQGANFNLGCSQYADRNNIKHNLHNFNQLCANSSVGCEQMIDTKNYGPYGSGIWNDTNQNGVCDSNEADCVKVAGDSALYAIYDPAKSCNDASLGCSRLGQKQSTGNYTDVYLNNNPNNYNQALCSQTAVGCNVWTNEAGGYSYFKDPGNNTCVYRAASDPAINGKGWYKSAVKRCDTNSNGKIEGTEKNGTVCSSTADCSGAPCINDTNDYACSISYNKTIGWGGAGNQVAAPDQAAGICSSNASGCTEYIDPVSSFMPNLVYNSGFEVTSGASTRAGWGAASPEKWNGQTLANNQQVVNLTPNKLYIFSIVSADGQNPAAATLNFVSGVKPLLTNNTFGTSTTSLTIPTGPNQHLFFNSLSNYRISLTGGYNGRTIEIREASLDYQISSNVDKKSCNGIAGFDNGCVLFNERSANASGLANLSSGWDAYQTAYGQAPATCDNTKVGSCTANQLIKVKPERVCSKWLDCLTYVKDPQTNAKTCYAVGECTRLDDKGECASFDNTPSDVRQFDSSTDKNSTGYSLIGNYYIDQMPEVGLNSDAHFDFEDSVPALSCERADNASACGVSKNLIVDNLVREPDVTPTDYPAHGKAFLKVPAAYLMSPQSPKNKISLLTDKTYYINYLVNTKGAGLAAKVYVYGFWGTTNKYARTDGKLLATYTDTANNGWQRIIHQFTTTASSTSGTFYGVRLYLGSDDPAKDGQVYYDDINIEPVLQTGPNTYVARECRLYPSDDSLTCTNKNNNVIANGWEGYCLQHDSANPNNCLMWYPVDQISSAVTVKPSLGYQGKYPLNYCTEANGNFNLVEKRVPKLVGISECEGARWYNSDPDLDGIHNVYGVGPVADEIGTYWATHGVNVLGPALIKNFCGDTAVGHYWLQIQSHGNFTANEKGYYSFVCIPAFIDIKGKLVRQGEDLIIPGQHCRNEDSDVKLGTWEGWFIYNGLNTNNGVSFSGTIPVDIKYYFDESKNANPPVRVYDYDHPVSDEEGLKLINSQDPDTAFRLTCNKFTQVVDYTGESKAWAVRTGINSVWATQTPPYFVKPVGSSYEYFATSTNSIQLYGRNRGDIPFGSASWPDTFNLLSGEQVKFASQYSKKNNEDVLAGRPYGCGATAAGAAGCSNIGYCSLDPSVYCLLYGTSTNDYVAIKSCSGGGYGTCLPLWKSNLGSSSPYDYLNILKTIFLKTYNSFSYQNGYYVPGSSDYDESDATKLPQCSSNRPVANYSSVSNAADSFCAIYPEVGDYLVVKSNGRQVNSNNSNTFNVATRGVYSLEFTTNVDPEQQPLKEIYIIWGDGTEQAIEGQDSRSSASNPHIFYHYYQQTGSKTIIINVKDNWGRFGSCVSGFCYPSVYNNVN